MIYHKKTNLANPCVLFDWIKKPHQFAKLKKDFFIFHVRAFMPLLQAFNLFYQKDIFISRPFYSRPVVYFLSNQMIEPARRKFNHYVAVVLEKGFAKKSMIDIQQVIDDNYVNFKSTFQSTQEYVAAYTHFIEAITMDQFE